MIDKLIKMFARKVLNSGGGFTPLPSYVQAS